MSFILKFWLPRRPFLTRLLQTAGLSLALMTASAAGVYAEDVTVQGSPGVDGASGVNTFVTADTVVSQSPFQTYGPDTLQNFNPANGDTIVSGD